MVKKVLKEHQPWNLSYKISADARPSWSKHGMPVFYNEFIKLVENIKSDDGMHLDIGCGNAVKTVNYALAGFETMGIDISKDGFKEARELIKELRVGKRCRVIQANCLKLPFEDGSVDSTSDYLCFTHIKLKDQKKYNSELYRVLKPGGYVLMVSFSDKDKHFHGHKVSKRYTFRFDPINPLMEGYAHYHGMVNVHFSSKDIERIFGKEFEIVEMKEVSHPLYSHRFLWNIILRKPLNES